MMIKRKYLYVLYYKGNIEDEKGKQVELAINEWMDELGIVPDDIISIQDIEDLKDQSFNVSIYYKAK